MPNLEQIRAAHALHQATERELKKAGVDKLPGMIINNGLLATAAFSLAGAEGNRTQMAQALEATAAHLSAQRYLAPNNGTLNGMIQDLSAGNSLKLQRATQEALAYLSYLKRFSKA